jgi:hypothetical protein
MQAIRVEIVASSLQGGGTLIDADQSFRVRFDGPQKMVVEILGQILEFSLADLPVGNWVTFEFSHDGVSQLDFGYGFTWPSGLGGGAGSGVPLNVPGQVPAVGPQGVCFGNQIGNPAAHLNGNIASVKIWRVDPQAMTTTFIGRPFTPPQLECWGNFLKKINEVSSNDPECAAWLAGAVDQVHNYIFAKLAQKGSQAVAEFWNFCQAYQKLWVAGKVGSTEMQDLVVRLRDWLKSEQIFSADDPDLQGILHNPCIGTFAGAVGGLDCDADAQTLLKAILGA